MQRIARRALHDLLEVRLGISPADLTERPRPVALPDESRGGHGRKWTARHLLKRAAPPGSIAQEHTNPQQSLAPDRCHFDQRAVTHFVRYREHTTIGKVDVADRHSVLMQRPARYADVHPKVPLQT